MLAPRAGLLACLAATLFVACSISGPETPDGSPLECDTSLQNCPEGQTCDLICDGTVSKIACRATTPADAGTVGNACVETTDCAKGTGCYNTSATPPTSTCVAYCATDADCPTGFACRDRSIARGCGVAPPTYHVKLCRPSST
jgi:Cys-rich repeat protein